MAEKQKQQKSTDTEHTKQSKIPLILTAVLIGGLVLAYFLIPDFQAWLREGWGVLKSGDEQEISSWVGQFGIWGPVFIIAAMIVQMFLFVVNVVALMLVAIIAYGPWLGSVIAVTAVVVASTIGYIIGRLIGQNGVRKLIGHKAERKVSEFVDDYGTWAIIIARVSPVLSNDAVSFVAGVARMGYVRFISATLAGIVPLTILLAWLGKDYDTLKSGLIWVGVVSLVIFIGYIVYDKYFRKKS
ncbi:TVP38/TMEM64 family protein [Botryobacter ruber]|uniref:TVP38/TMEM64 family protein n=1 Tax=Botryobacter ruber TaxID=2171629 RepID=UPI000E09EF8B|nr:VTT domain-containing protein [Botryobacter ruber]